MLFKARKFEEKKAIRMTKENAAIHAIFTKSHVKGIQNDPLGQADVCIQCQVRVVNVVLFNCHHIIVCRECARVSSFCPLRGCQATVVCFMRL